MSRSRIEVLWRRQLRWQWWFKRIKTTKNILFGKEIWCVKSTFQLLAIIFCIYPFTFFVFLHKLIFCLSLFSFTLQFYFHHSLSVFATIAAVLFVTRVSSSNSPVPAGSQRIKFIINWPVWLCSYLHHGREKSLGEPVTLTSGDVSGGMIIGEIQVMHQQSYSLAIYNRVFLSSLQFSYNSVCHVVFYSPRPWLLGEKIITAGHSLPWKS